MEEKLEVSADAKKEFRLATSLRNGTKTFFAPRHLFFVVVQVVAGMYGWHYWHYLPAPGFAIGIAALLAAVMAVHLDMRVLHRAIWILLVGAFVVIDLQAITKDRDDNTKDRKATADAFSSLVTLQNKALTSNQINFENALGRLENLTNQQTGGNSIPIIYNTDPKVDEKGGLTLEISLQGKYPLSPLHVSIFPHLQDVKSGKTRAQDVIKDEWIIPDLTAYSPETLQHKIYPQLNPGDGETDIFQITFTAHNGVYNETMFVTENKYRQFTGLWKLYDVSGRFICDGDHFAACAARGKPETTKSKVKK